MYNQQTISVIKTTSNRNLSKYVKATEAEAL